MPEKVNFVASCSEQQVAHQPETGFQRKYRAAMDRRIGQSSVAIVAADKKIEASSVNPRLSFDVGQHIPGKRALRVSLIQTIDGHRVVCPSTPKSIALSSLAHIFIRARIDEQGVTIAANYHAEGIGMTVSGSLHTLGSCVDDHLIVRAAAGHDVQPTA